MASSTSNGISPTWNPEPFTISISEEGLQDLKSRLANVRLPDELEDSHWTRGVPLKDVKRLVNYWKEGYDWRAQEQRLNTLPQFLVRIEVEQGHGELDIHFIHSRSKDERAIPLLFVHGWPGHFGECTKLLPLLTDSGGAGPHFHVVAPSLPNFGFSQGSKKTGFGIKQYAEVCHKLMKTLGYDTYVTQGGDWGYIITRAIGWLYPESCKASHLNMLPIGPPTALKNPWIYLQSLFTTLSDKERGRIQRQKDFSTTGRAYLLLQSTKPQTLGYGLADSPTFLLAWIWEKLYAWSDMYPWTDDEILTWVSIYWFSTAGPEASSRIYHESIEAHDPDLSPTFATAWIPHVKYGITHMPKEIIDAPGLWARVLGNIVHESEAEFGGHFAAWENPEFIAEDLRKMFFKMKVDD